MSFNVIIPDCLVPPLAIEEKALNGIASVSYLDARSQEELNGKLSDADGILMYHELSLREKEISQLDKCRIIVRCGVGYDNVDIKAAGARGITVCNVPDYGVDEVADHAIGLMLACNRGIIRAERNLRQTLQPWNNEAVLPVFRIAGSTIGIVGCGRIGAATVLRAKAMRMRVLVYDPYLRSGMDKVYGVEQVDFETLLKNSDVVSLHTPLTEETRHLIDAKALSLMKPTSILVNTARGDVIDIDALAEALEKKQIAGAGIDVLPIEPPNAEMSLIKLWQKETEVTLNLVITPHTAYYSEMGFYEMRSKGAEEMARFLSGKPILNCVNAEWLKS